MIVLSASTVLRYCSVLVGEQSKFHPWAHQWFPYPMAMETLDHELDGFANRSCKLDLVVFADVE